MKLPRVLILAGGLGTRLAGVLVDRPKPMALIQGRPLLEYQIEYLKNQGFSDFTLLVGHMSSVIEQHFGNGAKFGVRIHYSVETTPLGTGGAIRSAIETSSEDTFIVLNGDGLFATDYRRFLNLSKAAISIALKYETDPARYGSVEINHEFCITAFHEKSATAVATGGGYINAGVYAIDRSALEFMPKGKFSIETEVFEPLSQRQVLTGVLCGGKFIDIGTPESYSASQTQLPQWLGERLQPCLFLDRDGVLIRHKPYMFKPEQVELIPETVQIVRQARAAGWWCVVITNQAGVARDYFSPTDCELVHLEIDRQLAQQRVIVDAWFTCFDHPDGVNPNYRRDSVCRKPLPGMVLQACDKLPIDLARSLMIGDNVSDQIELPDLRTFLIQGDFIIDRVRDNNQRFDTFAELVPAVTKIFDQN